MLDPINWIYAKDDTSPVEIEAFAPPQDPEVTGMWGWVEMKYADGFTLVMDSTEWGPRYSRKAERAVSINDLSRGRSGDSQGHAERARLIGFAQAVKTRQLSCGHPEAAHRTAALMHLANISIRMGRKIRFDPVKEEVIGDEEANLPGEPADACAVAHLTWTLAPRNTQNTRNHRIPFRVFRVFRGVS